MTEAYHIKFKVFLLSKSLKTKKQLVIKSQESFGSTILRMRKELRFEIRDRPIHIARSV